MNVGDNKNKNIIDNIYKMENNKDPINLPVITKALRSILLVWVIVTAYCLNLCKDVLMPFYRLFFAKRHPLFVRTPEHRFKTIPELGYPFTSKYLDLPLGSGGGDKLPR